MAENTNSNNVDRKRVICLSFKKFPDSDFSCNAWKIHFFFFLMGHTQWHSDSTQKSLLESYHDHMQCLGSSRVCRVQSYPTTVLSVQTKTYISNKLIIRCWWGEFIYKLLRKGKGKWEEVTRVRVGKEEETDKKIEDE